MILTTGQRLNFQSFTLLPLLQDVINGVHRLACRNPKRLNIQDRDQCPFLKTDDRTDDNRDNSTYNPSDDNIRHNEYESDNNQSNHDNLHLYPDQ